MAVVMHHWLVFWGTQTTIVRASTEDRAFAAFIAAIVPLLDLFCGAGGAAMGYHRAGFDVLGVDVKSQRNYPFDFIKGDWRWFLDKYGVEHFDVIHASPPCQDHSPLHHSAGSHGTGWMLIATMERLRASGKPWVVENVGGSGLTSQPDLFGESARLRRKWKIGLEQAVATEIPTVDSESKTCAAKHDAKLPTAKRELAMGIDWMSRDELSQAIPPAYTEFIGEQLLTSIPASLGTET